MRAYRGAILPERSVMPLTIRPLHPLFHGDDALVDISNLDESGDILDTYARRRMYSLGNRLWHCDAAFNDPRGRYSMLHAREVTPGAGDTEFCDLRAVYDELD